MGAGERPARGAAGMGEGYAGHVVLCGLDRLGFRTLEELRRLGEEVVVVARAPDADLARDAEALGAVLVAGNQREEAVLRRAGVMDACAAVIVEDDDVGNLHAALAAQELNPGLRIVLRLFNQELGRRVQALFRDCIVLSSSAIAAPAFVSAALHQDGERRIEVAGRLLALRPGTPGGAGVLLPLARLSDDGPVVLFPDDGAGALCLVDTGPAGPGDAAAAARRRAGAGAALAGLWAQLGAVDRRLRAMVFGLLGLALLSALIFRRFAGLSLIDAVYFTVTIITTTGFGDITLRDAPPALKLYGVVLMLLGAAGLTIFYALITDMIVGARLTRALGGVHRRLRDHVVVCGLGSIGYRVVEQLASAGVPVVAAELQERARFLPAVRRLGVPTLIADTRLVETLRALHIAQARCLVAATNDDVANLETALHARALNPDLRVVLRLFEPDLAARVERAFGIHISRSVSALAAPAFAAAAVGQRVLATVPVGARAVVVAQARIEAGSWAAGRSVAALERDAECRVLLVADGARREWRPDGDTALAAGQELTVVATRQGLAQLLARTGAGGAMREGPAGHA
jgi:Trk K+ transport system NAD-binding subunit